MTQLNWYWCSLENRTFGHYSYRLVRTLLCGTEVYCMLYRTCAVSNTLFQFCPMHLPIWAVVKTYWPFMVHTYLLLQNVLRRVYTHILRALSKRKRWGMAEWGPVLSPCSYCAIHTRVEGTHFRENNQVRAISCLRFQKQIISLSL